MNTQHIAAKHYNDNKDWSYSLSHELNRKIRGIHQPIDGLSVATKIAISTHRNQLGVHSAPTGCVPVIGRSAGIVFRSNSELEILSVPPVLGEEAGARQPPLFPVGAVHGGGPRERVMPRGERRKIRRHVGVLRDVDHHKLVAAELVHCGELLAVVRCKPSVVVLSADARRRQQHHRALDVNPAVDQLIGCRDDQNTNK